MDNKRKVALFAALAANQSIAHIFLILQFVLMGIFLLVAGYYAGLARSQK